MIPLCGADCPANARYALAPAYWKRSQGFPPVTHVCGRHLGGQVNIAIKLYGAVVVSTP